MPQSRSDQHQCTLSIRKGAHYSRSSLDLPHQPLQRVIGSQATPVFRRHRVVTQCLVDPRFHDLRGSCQTHLTQLDRNLVLAHVNAMDAIVSRIQLLSQSVSKGRRALPVNNGQANQVTTEN
jgi:porphobilinogen deaminase